MKRRFWEYSVTSDCARLCLFGGIGSITIFHKSLGCLVVACQSFCRVFITCCVRLKCVCREYKAERSCQCLCGGHMATPWARGILVGGGTGHWVYHVCVCVRWGESMTKLRDLMRRTGGQRQKAVPALAQWFSVSASEGGASLKSLLL